MTMQKEQAVEKNERGDRTGDSNINLEIPGQETDIPHPQPSISTWMEFLVKLSNPPPPPPPPTNPHVPLPTPDKTYYTPKASGAIYCCCFSQPPAPPTNPPRPPPPPLIKTYPQPKASGAILLLLFFSYKDCIDTNTNLEKLLKVIKICCKGVKTQQKISVVQTLEIQKLNTSFFLPQLIRTGHFIVKYAVKKTIVRQHMYAIKKLL